jgi:hypothetical protein
MRRRLVRVEEVPMRASVHVADVGARWGLALTRKPPPAGSIAGLRNAEVGVAAPLSAALLPKPQFGRAAFIGFWDDDESIDRFVAEHPLAVRFASGWQVRLEPLRAFGTWPGLPPEVPSARSVEHDGPVVVVTLGRLRASQAVRFFRATAKAEGAVVNAPGLLWATGIARVPKIVATCSLWESSKAAATYAYGHREPAHSDAIAASEAKAFHHQQAFIRFRPYDLQGHLDGRNPLPDGALANA